MELSSPQWQQAYRLLDDALDLPSSERADWLANLTAGEAHLKPLLEQMLADHARMETEKFLDQPVKFTQLDGGDATFFKKDGAQDGK